MNTKLYQEFNDGLTLRGYAERSKESYIWRIKKLSEYYVRSPDEITDEELHQYLLHLLRDKKYSHRTMGIVTAALRLFYRIVCRRSTESLLDVLPITKNVTTLPRFYSKEEIARLLCAEGIRMKQRTMLITAYASGLRVKEVCNLKVKDILSSRMQIYVERGSRNLFRPVRADQASWGGFLNA